MFKTAAKRIAHNSTIPVLGGNKDLRGLQDLITAEKAVLNSLQRLSADIARASEALKAWGLGEGDDLGDTLSAACALHLHFSDALQAFASHEMTVREHMKSVRTREEHLDELRQRRKSLASNADSAEKKLSKMGPDNKHLQVQMDHLNKLREDIRIMDTDIMAEEASLGDYKRSASKAWLGYKFGGLAECCEKGIIIGDHGRLVIAEILLDRTEPGVPRTYYGAHDNTESLVVDARRALSTVTFSVEPNLGGVIRPAHIYDSPDIPHGPPVLPVIGLQGRDSRRTSMIMPVPTGDYQLSDTASSIGPMPRSPLSGGYSSVSQPLQSSYSDPSRHSYTGSSATTPPAEAAEFGVLPPESYSPRVSSMRSPEEREKPMVHRNSRFSTVPALGGPRPPPGMRDSLMYLQQKDGRPPSLDIDSPEDSFSSSVAEALGTQFEFDSGATTHARSSSVLTAPNGSTAIRDTKGVENRHRSYTPPPPLYSSVAGHDGDGNMDPQPAYIAPPVIQDETTSTRHSGDRKVKFEESSSGDSGSLHAASQEAGQSGQGQSGQQHCTPETSSPSNEDGKEGQVHAQEAVLNAPSPSLPAKAPSPPSVSPIREPTPPTDERSLNAEAAREVSREIDVLMSSPILSTPSVPVPKQSGDRTPSPLLPPQAPFARRSVSPRPPMDGKSSTPGSPRVDTAGVPDWVRERDRSIASPTTPLYNPYTNLPPVEEPSSPASRSRVSGDSPPTTMPSIALQRPSPSASAFSVNTNASYRTPLSENMSPLSSPFPTQSAPSSSFYTLPAASGSGKISAAAFRRQARSPSLPIGGPGSEVAGVDTSPLFVKKRPLPTSPSGSNAPLRPAVPRMPSAPLVSGGSLDTGEVGGRLRSTSTVQPSGDRSSRFDGAGSDEDYDYVSAYTGPEGQRPEEGPAGYEQGRFATNLEQDGGVRLR